MLVSMTLRTCLKLNCDDYMTKKRSSDSCLYSRQCVPLRNGHTTGTNPPQYVTEVRFSSGVASTEYTDSHIVDSLDSVTARRTSTPPLPRRPTDRSLSERIAYVSHLGDGCLSSSESDRTIFYHIYQLQVSHPRSRSNV